MADETKAIQEVVLRYHQAITDKDLKTTLGCVGPTLYGNPKETAAMQKQIARVFKSPKTTYANKIEVLHTSIAKKAALALVVTKETGSATWLNGRTLSWKGAINLWCLAKVRGKWRIIRSMHNISKGAPAR